MQQHTPRHSARTWGRQALGATTYQILNVLFAAINLHLVVLLIVGVATTPIFLVGVPLLAFTLIATPAIATIDRARIYAFLGVTITPPAHHTDGSWWRQLFLNRRRWRYLGYCAIHAIWGFFSGTIVYFGAFYTCKVLLATVLTVTQTSTKTVTFYLITTTTELHWALAALIGLSLILATLAIAWLLSRVDILLGQALLGTNPNQKIAELSTQVTTLTQTRAETVSSVEAERRRIERDLHDGPQQRLVSIAMDLSLAKAQLNTNPEASQQLIDQAHAASKEAITEMRHVARGITPPILTDRGLAAALSALAAKSPIPTTITVDLPHRPHPDIEAVAYFCVSEAMTNVAKHAHADQITITIGTTNTPGPTITLEVTDDGRGGVDPSKGTGITGLTQRLAAVDGTLTIDSPPGGPTTVHATLPNTPRPTEPEQTP